ncbi:MAG TPA: deoxyribonuclease IV [Chitinispirillaceae bacterium]|nr:deoxyribonuclease IV [Chitinispirillaceae bacterium]
MKLIGPHVSIAGGVQNAPLNAKALGATAFGMFTKNQRRWDAPPLDDKTIDSFKKNLNDTGFAPQSVLAHDSYLINIGHPEKENREKSLNALIDELQRCNQLGLTCLNIHPGSHLGLCSETQCLSIIAESINSAFNVTENVAIVLENTAGQGSNLGYRFEHLAHIIDQVHDKKRIGFCIDTCHLYSAGYDIGSKDAYEKTMSDLDRIVGFQFLRGVHLNDSKTSIGSKVDRHHSIGMGNLGVQPFGFIMNDCRFEQIPMVLETIDETLWASEIRLLNSLVCGGLN